MSGKYLTLYSPVTCRLNPCNIRLLVFVHFLTYLHSEECSRMFEGFQQITLNAYHMHRNFHGMKFLWLQTKTGFSQFYFHGSMPILLVFFFYYHGSHTSSSLLLSWLLSCLVFELVLQRWIQLITLSQHSAKHCVAIDCINRELKAISCKHQHRYAIVLPRRGIPHFCHIPSHFTISPTGGFHFYGSP